jgi:hypothetical protein
MRLAIGDGEKPIMREIADAAGMSKPRAKEAEIRVHDGDVRRGRGRGKRQEGLENCDFGRPRWCSLTLSKPPYRLTKDGMADGTNPKRSISS